MKVRKVLPVSMSHIFMKASPEAVRIRFWLRATALTGPRCPESDRKNSPVCRFQTRVVVSCVQNRFVSLYFQLGVRVELTFEQLTIQFSSKQRSSTPIACPTRVILISYLPFPVPSSPTRSHTRILESEEPDTRICSSY